MSTTPTSIWRRTIAEQRSPWPDEAFVLFQFLSRAISNGHVHPRSGTVSWDFPVILSPPPDPGSSVRTFFSEAVAA